MALLLSTTLTIIPSIIFTIWYTDFQRIYLFALASIILSYPILSATLGFLMTAQDPYGLFHLSLNKLPGDNSNANPRTEWLNMGYWKDTNVFPEACEALALKLVSTAGCKEDGHVLDVGHGTGESLLFQLGNQSVPRPSSLTGITSLRIHYERSLDRVTRLQSSHPDTKTTEVNLHHADAVYRQTSINHPLDPSSQSTPFTTILALDCAYHFDTRQDFLCQSYKRLAAGGRIALADIVFTSDALSNPSLKARILMSVLRLMPKANMITTEQYVQDMKDIGYVDVLLEDLSDGVFPGFQTFLRSRGLGWATFAAVIGGYYSVGARFVIASGSKSPRYFHLPHISNPKLSMTAIQAVYIRGHEERSTPKPHTVYTIEIQAHVRSWQMWRRYSEFVDLHTELTKSTGAAPPHALPPKHSLSILRSHSDKKLLEERRAGLESYLRSIVSAKDDRWRESFAFRDFLGVPVGRHGGVQGGPPAHFTLSSWLDEHMELQSRIRDVRADINKRDALADRNDVNGSQKANVEAKKKLAGVLSRIGTLGEGLRELGMGGMSEGELQRRTDMVAKLQDDCEKLGKMVTIARMSSRGLVGSADRNPASETAREALLGGTPSGTSKPFARVFGSSPAQPEETDRTRPLDDHGVIKLQAEQMAEQDAQLEQLATILHRQRHLGEAIGWEINSQIELLRDLDNDVDNVGGKLTHAKGQMNRLG